MLRMKRLLLLLALVRLHAHDKQFLGSLFHVGGESLHARKDVVVEYLKNNSGNDTEDSGNQSDLHTTSHNGRTDITGSLNLLE